MKQPFTSYILLLTLCLSFSFAQGIHGNVQLRGQATVLVTGHSVTLTWNASQNAASYDIYRSTVHGGPYVRWASGIVSTTYTDTKATHNQTLYYVTTAVNGNNESGYSNEAVAVIP
jgi:fibronectin type 3 domain-containing protein